MIGTAALYSESALPPERGRTLPDPDPDPASDDPIRTLSEAFSRPGNPLYRSPGTPAQRPLDAQYWACWAVTFLLPAVLAYLWLSA